MAQQPHHRVKANAFAPNDHAPWTLEEQQRIVDNRTGCDRDLAISLGRSEQAVQTKRHHIGRHGFTDPAGATGTYSYGANLKHGDACPGCNVALPLTGVCDDCS
jgi:hypothetical protein